MKIFSYGEDALTLWALKEKLGDIIENDKDNDPIIFYRPSFGRSGGESSSQFGEFDFIIITKNTVYLGESKWEQSSEINSKGEIKLRDNQITRHKVMEEYIQAIKKYENEIDKWDDFKSFIKKNNLLSKENPEGHTVIANNLKTVLNKIYSGNPKREVVNIILVFRKDEKKKFELIKNTSGLKFKIFPVEYSTEQKSNYFKMEI